MNKKIILFTFTLISALSFSQVGVNTPNPQGVFNIDGGKDNPKTGSSHTPAQQMNDVTVLNDGKVGFGTIAPTNKVHIITDPAITPANGFKLVDGNQAAVKLLGTVNNTNGTGTWTMLNAAKGMVMGNFSGSSFYSDGNGNKNIGASITLSPGVWIVNMGLTVYYATNDTGVYQPPFWLHGYLSSSNADNASGNPPTAGFKKLGPSGNNSCYAGVIGRNGDPGSPNMLSGTVVIEVTAATAIPIYVSLDNLPLNSVNNPGATGNMWRFDAGSWENFFYAIPVNK